jgi:hypothetical protein
VHLVVEADGTSSLSRGVQGLSIRVARRLNRLMGQTGRLFADRFHSRILRSPVEVRRALLYVRGNHDVHRSRWRQVRPGEPDPFSSASAQHGVMLPRALTYLLKRARRELDGGAPT